MEIVELPDLANGRKRPGRIDTIVIHSMAQYLDTEPYDMGAYDFLKSVGLSAHALIDPSGCILRCADDDALAYHAKGHNTRSLGVEILVPGLHTYSSFLCAIAQRDWYTMPQYHATVDLVRWWLDKHHLTPRAVKTHSNLSPGRKRDPGEGFPYSEFLKEIANL